MRTRGNGEADSDPIRAACASERTAENTRTNFVFIFLITKPKTISLNIKTISIILKHQKPKFNIKKPIMVEI